VTGWPLLPGETPIDDVSGLKIKGIRTRKELNILEAENIRNVVVKYLAVKPSRRTARFDVAWARRLHKEMFGDVWKWAGQFRTEDLNIGVAWHQVETSLQNLLDDLKCWLQHGTGLLDQAVMLHHRAVQIHPFRNGNGRWARMLANIWLRRHDHPPTEWPEETVGAQSTIRDEYIKAIRLADEGDYGPLMELHQRYTPEDKG
jgi:Fic-DOC domain mobile mystery protein B